MKTPKVKAAPLRDAPMSAERRPAADAGKAPASVKATASAKAPGPAKAIAKAAPRGTGPKPRRKVKSAYTPAEIEEIFRRFRVQRPEPKGELEHVNPFTLVVAVALSAQATDVGVNKATRALFAAADTPEKMLALGEDRVRDFIRTIGLYRNKAKNVIALSEMLVRDFGGVVPQTREELVRLPGVGRKTANVVLSMAFGQSTLAVDTHIFRLANRLQLAPGKTPDQVEDNLLAVIPAPYLYHAHHWLILHGRYVCKARRPECARCIIADLCKAAEKTNAIPAPLLALPAEESVAETIASET